MVEWKVIESSASYFLKTRKLREAEKEITNGLKSFPHQINLLIIATDIYRASNNLEKSLKYSELLVNHHPDKWQGYGRSAQDLVALKRFKEAQTRVREGLQKHPNQLNLLIIATDVSREAGDREKFLEYAELLITHHPENWNGYGRVAQLLNAQERFNKTSAQKKIQEGLQKLPNQLNLLIIATDIYRESGDREKSLKYAELLTTHHPENWNGYGRKAQNLVALKRLEEAQKEIQAGLEKLPNQLNLLTIATDVYHASGDRKKFLKHTELLMTHHPKNWNGYGRAIHEAIISQKLKTARLIAEKGISKTNRDEYFFAILSDIAYAQGDERTYDTYEKLLAKKVFKEDIYGKLALTPKSIKSQLKTEFATTAQGQPGPDTNKPDLYIVAGFSGCGKTTLLNTAHFSIDNIFATRQSAIKIPPAEIIEFLRKRRSISPNLMQAMLFSNCFGLLGMPFLCRQKILPKQTLLHLDLANLFLSRRLWELTGINCLTPDEFKSASNLKQHLLQFFEIPFFKKFNSMSIATLEIDFDTNAERYARRGGKFYFDHKMKNTYNQAIQVWHEHIYSLPTAINNSITESNGYYGIKQK
jgi:tetratricopeptide (TPR) repeat protein